MECSQCRAVAVDGQRFCGQCGQPLVAVCGACSTENPPGNRFCGSCGTALGEAPAPTPVPDVERRIVSVLFIDLVGFTSFSENRDPEDVRRVVTAYFDVAKEIVDRFGGTIDKFIGDAVMAWWGATSSQEDDAERAVRTALELVDRVAALGVELGVDGLSARAGVMTGEASVGPGGNDHGVLLGDMVNLASRIQSLAEPGSVAVGSTTADLVGSAIEVVEAGTHAVKGRDEPVTIHRAVRMVSERGGRNRSEVLEPPFVGREAELRLLKDALHATGRDRRLRLVSLVGQGGIGKSRLLWELQKYCDGLVEDVYWHEGRSPSYGERLALWSVAEMVRSRADIGETETDEVAGEKLDRIVEAWVPEADRAWVRMRLATLLGVGGAEAGERSELYGAVRALFDGMAARGSVVLVFEDLHWADPATLEFIDELADWSQSQPVLVVSLARPDLLDRRPDWGTGRVGFSSSHLGPLADGEMADLIVGTVGDIDPTAVSRIVSAAGGVPLFAVEMLRMLVADGRVAVGGGTTGDIGEIEIPSSVHAVVGARLDRMPSDLRDLARDASVLGQSFTLPGLAALREEEVDKVERRLGELVRREILEVVRDPRSPERGQYRWLQTVLQEVAYGRITKDLRRDLHLRVARYFRGLDEPELAPVAAAHFATAVELDDDETIRTELVDSVRSALDRSVALHAHEQIISLVDSVVDVVDVETEFEFRELAARAAHRLLDADTADRHVAAVRAIADSTGRIDFLHRSMALFGRVGLELLRSQAVAEVLEPHIEAHPDLESHPALAEAATQLARARGLRGDDVGSQELAMRAVPAADRLGLTEAVADGLITWGTSIARKTEHQSVALLEGAIQLARRHGHSDPMIRGLINVGYASWDIPLTLASSQEAFDTAKRVGDRGHATFVARNLAFFHIYGLELERAEAVMNDPAVKKEGLSGLGFALMDAELAYIKGEEDRADQLLQQWEKFDTDDPQELRYVSNAKTTRAYYRRDPELALDLIRARFEDGRFVDASDATRLLQAVAIARARGAFDEAAETARRVAQGKFGQILPVLIDAIGAAFDERFDDAVDGYRTLLGGHEAMPFVLIEWWTCLGAALLLPDDHPGRDQFVDRARNLAEPAGAHGLVTLLDRYV